MSGLEKKFFLSGAYTGCEDKAREYFEAASKTVEEKFPLATVYNPMNIPASFSYSSAMKICSARIKGWATDIVYLRNEFYDDSKGACMERGWAKEKGLGEYVFRDNVLSALPKEAI